MKLPPNACKLWDRVNTLLVTKMVRFVTRLMPTTIMVDLMSEKFRK